MYIHYLHVARWGCISKQVLEVKLLSTRELIEHFIKFIGYIKFKLNYGFLGFSCFSQ